METYTTHQMQVEMEDKMLVAIERFNAIRCAPLAWEQRNPRCICRQSEPARATPARRERHSCDEQHHAHDEGRALADVHRDPTASPP